ncbi:MAG TPA: tripartite tricarboxylate transporter substrate binding protein [Burkholderiales bacterium]|nr:tripartite tricarboxylate transporter substrate binding protein [Burkholderiales bacterium]
MTRMRLWAACAGIVITALVAGPAHAQHYPSRPVRMILPSSPTGPVDVLARAISQAYGDALGQQLVLDNRAGAGGAIGAELVAHGNPDGYTIMLSHSGPLAIEHQLHLKAGYDPLRDFEPVSLVAASPYLLLVHPAVPAKSVQELVALAKSRPGKLNYASGGPGTGIHMAAELLNLVAGIKVVHVPYKGAGPGMTALLGAEVDMMFNGVSSALPQVKAGKLRALAVGSAKRSQLLPDLPTIAESGLKYDTSGWYGLVAPKATPRAVVMQLHAGLVQALADAPTKERLATLGIEGIGSKPEEFRGYLKEEVAKWGKVIQSAGLKAQ